MNLTIRHPMTKDAKRVADICSDGWKQTVEGKLSKTVQLNTVQHWYNYEKVRSDIKKGNYTYVAEIDGDIAGVIGSGIVSKKVGQIFVFYVDQRYRYRGVGKQLLKQLTDKQKKKGVIIQRVSVQKDNEFGIPFYKSNGFEVVGERSADTGTNEVQVSLKMERSLI